ncbi:MAG: VTT domain-containing protein [Clostridium sp.]
MFDIDMIVVLFNEYHNIAIFISLIISIIIALSGVIPSVFVTGANILFFGPLYGFLISLLGETIGAYITFIVYRKGFKKTVENFVDKYSFVKKIVDSSGKKAYFLIFQGRLLPFVPSGFITLAGAVSSMKVIPFTLATLFGKVPSIALEALVSYDVINIQENWIRLVITLLAVIMIWITIKKREVK